MKTVTTREFLHAPGLVKTLRAGQQLLVTDNGQASFVITKAGQRPRRTLADLERQAKEIFPVSRATMNLTEIIKGMKK